METDREVLLWLHQRLVNQHRESHLYDYMHRLRWIIQAMPHDKMSRGQRVKGLCNNVTDLGKLLKHKTRFEKTMLARATEKP